MMQLTPQARVVLERLSTGRWVLEATNEQAWMYGDVTGTYCSLLGGTVRFLIRHKLIEPTGAGSHGKTILYDITIKGRRLWYNKHGRGNG